MAKKTREQLAREIGKLISNDRNKTHGDPHIQFACASHLKAVSAEFRTEAGLKPLPLSERESLDLILTKVSRISCGSNARDHWLDIAGYALIAAEATDE